MKRFITCLILILITITFFVGPAFAQEEAASVEEKSFFELYVQPGGWIGAFIILMSVVGIGLTILNAMTIRRENLVPQDLYEHIEVLFDEGEYEQVMEICETQSTFLTNVLASGLPMVGTGYENVEKAMADVTDMEATKLHQQISYLNLIANLSPMCGLLGTVYGMIEAFAVIASKDSPKPAELAGGIQGALVTTMLGLIVAIPIMAAFFYFRNRIVRVVMEVGAISEDLMSRFREEE